MAYTPELNSYQSSTLRRIAWALDQPMTKAMTKAMTAIFEYVGNIIDNKRICAACKDKSRCITCVFNEKKEVSEKNSEKE